MLGVPRLDRYFRAIVGGDEVARPKPAPDLPRHSAKALGVRPEDCVVVGDAPVDILAGRAARTWTGAATDGHGDPRALPDGSRIRSCGIGLRKPMAFVYEIMRQTKRDLTFLQSGMTEDADLLIGAGCVARVEGSYLGLGAFGLAQCYRRSIEKGVPRRIEIEEYSNFGMTMRFMAAAMGLPCMPIRSQLGTPF